MSPAIIIGEFYLINIFFINVIIRVFSSVLSGTFRWRSNDSAQYSIFSIFISSDVFAKPFETILSLLGIMDETINIIFHNFSILF